MISKAYLMGDKRTSHPKFGSIPEEHVETMLCISHHIHRVRLALLCLRLHVCRNLRAVRCLRVGGMKCGICMPLPEIPNCAVQNTFHDGDEGLRTKAPKNSVVHLRKVSGHYTVPCPIHVLQQRPLVQWLSLDPTGEALDVPRGPPSWTSRLRIWSLVPLVHVFPAVLIQQRP